MHVEFSDLETRLSEKFSFVKVSMLRWNLLKEKRPYSSSAINEENIKS